jgi:tRNA(adenine34) deaminase
MNPPGGEMDPVPMPPGGTIPDPVWIDLQSDRYFMGEALRMARRAYRQGEVPVGAVVVHQGQIIARAHNQVETLKDATAHAEMLALTQAQQVVGDWRLAGCTLYVTKEPCPMCAGAMVLARCDRVVFGAHDSKGGAAGGAMNILRFPTLNHACAIEAGVEELACRHLLRSFFAEQRQRNAARREADPVDPGGPAGDWSGEVGE